MREYSPQIPRVLYISERSGTTHYNNQGFSRPVYVAPNRGAVFSICRVLRRGSVRILVFENLTVRCGAVRCGFMCIGFHTGQYGAVRCGLKSYGKVRCCKQS